MEALGYSGFKQINNNQQYTHSSINHWLVVSPRQITLHGMTLTANFNIQNAHQHLAVKFIIKSYINSEQVPFLQIFPQQGKIMRGQIKKIRVKFAKQFKPQLQQNNLMRIKIFVTLNTQFNKQYMKANRLTGWDRIKDLPVEQYEIPVRISSDFRQIKQNIRQSVMFESQFGKISQDMSSLYGQQKFQIPEIGIHSRQNMVKSKQKPLYSQIKRLSQSRRSLAWSQKKKQKGQALQNDKFKHVYFGNEPKISQSKIQNIPSIGNSQHRSHRSKSQSKHSPMNKKQDAYQVNYFKKGLNSSKQIISSEGNIFKQFQGNKLPSHNLKMKNPFLQNQQNSQVSILRSLEGKNSNDRNYKQKQSFDKLFTNEDLSIFKEYKTVDNQFHRQNIVANDQYSQPKLVSQPYQGNQRSMELIVLAIIAGLFVALGSNFGRMVF